MHCLHLSLARRLGKPEGGQPGGGLGVYWTPYIYLLPEGIQGREQGGRGERGGRGPEVGVWACIHLSLCRLGALENNKG